MLSTFACPSCGSQLTASNDLPPGTQVKCPRCGSEFPLPNIFSTAAPIPDNERPEEGEHFPDSPKMSETSEKGEDEDRFKEEARPRRRGDRNDDEDYEENYDEDFKRPRRRRFGDDWDEDYEEDDHRIGAHPGGGVQPVPNRPERLVRHCEGSLEQCRGADDRVLSHLTGHLHCGVHGPICGRYHQSPRFGAAECRIHYRGSGLAQGKTVELRRFLRWFSEVRRPAPLRPSYCLLLCRRLPVTDPGGHHCYRNSGQSGADPGRRHPGSAGLLVYWLHRYSDLYFWDDADSGP